MENLNFEDRLNVWDSRIKGVVVMEDINGKVIFKKENMIVKEGRDYIKALVLNKILGSSTETRKINSIQFGTGNDMTTSERNTLTDRIEDYDIEISENKWIKRPYSTSYIVTFGSTDPGVVVGDYFFNTDTNILKVGVAGDPDLWQEVEPTEGIIIYNLDKTIVRRFSTAWSIVSSGTTFPVSPTVEDYFYDTTPDIGGLYLYEKVFKAENLSGEVGIMFTIILQGTDSASQLISEIGLFLDGTGSKMFSRVVFEPVPINSDVTYRLKYYIYF